MKKPPNSQRWMEAAIALSWRGRALSAPNPNVGCILERDGRVVGRGWTQQGGRPHAEAMALAQAGEAARGATAWVSLEPCAHESSRGPACAALLEAAGVSNVHAALVDPDPRTAGKGLARLEQAGVSTHSGLLAADARHAMAGWLSQIERGRPFITLKLALSLDGCIARADGESQWITGAPARAHAHLERALSSMILVGRGTLEADAPRLDVRLPGLTDRSPARGLLSTRGVAPDGWTQLGEPADVFNLGTETQYLLIEGGAGAASAFLAAGLVDRLLLYRAPILIGSGRPCLGDIGLQSLADAHGQWRLEQRRMLGDDCVESYLRAS